jgi:hypothetical protein
LEQTLPDGGCDLCVARLNIRIVPSMDEAPPLEACPRCGRVEGVIITIPANYRDNQRDLETGD